jgi:hypothetical protein
MTPAGVWEIGLSPLCRCCSALYLVIRRRACSNRTAGAAGLLGFLGIACPVCHKILLLLLGSDLLLTYFESVRVYVAGAGVAVMSAAVLLECRRARCSAALSAWG